MQRARAVFRYDTILLTVCIKCLQTNSSDAINYNFSIGNRSLRDGTSKSKVS